MPRNARSAPLPRASRYNRSAHHPRLAVPRGGGRHPGVVSWAHPKVGAVPGLRVLFLGGTGIISSACSWLAVERGIDLFVLDRGQGTDRPLRIDAAVDALSDELAQAWRPGS
jgi:hypothetical protein